MVISALYSNGTAIFAATAYADYPTYNTSVVVTTNLTTWTTYFTSKMITAEAIGNYTGPGSMHNSLIVSGYASVGLGTYTTIGFYNTTRSSFQFLFNGTAYGSDDGMALAMFNSSQMVVTDAWNLDMIYSNNGLSWTDSYLGTNNPGPANNPYAWSFSIELLNGSIWGAYNDYAPGIQVPSVGGIFTWNGSAQVCYNQGKTLFCVSNNLVGGINGLWNKTSKGWGADAGIWIFNTTNGSLTEQILATNHDMMPQFIIYNSTNNVYYAFLDDKADNVAYVVEGIPP